MKWSSLFTSAVLIAFALIVIGCSSETAKDVMRWIHSKWGTAGASEVDLKFADALSMRDLEAAKRHLDEGADINLQYKNMGGYSVLMILANGPGFEEGIQFLFDNGADPNLRTTDGRTALIMAASKGNASYVELLLKASADPDVVANDGNTALSIAQERGHSEVVEILRGETKNTNKDS